MLSQRFGNLMWTARLTRDIQLENGKPLSLEKAQTSRDVVANAVMFPENISRKRIIERRSAIDVFPVFWRRLK